MYHHMCNIESNEFKEIQIDNTELNNTDNLLRFANNITLETRKMHCYC